MAWLWLFLSGPIATVLGKVIPIYLEPVRSKDIGGFMLAAAIGVLMRWGIEQYQQSLLYRGLAHAADTSDESTDSTGKT